MAWIDAVVVSRTTEAAGIAVFELATANGANFPIYTAGAHIDVLLDPPGLVRQYSLCDPPGGDRYRLAVLNEPNSRGGSQAMHGLAEGDKLRISEPRNRFALVAAERHLLFAGGIGITPLLSMARTLDAHGGDYVLHYCARSRANAAFVSELEDHPRVVLHFDDGDPGQLLNIDSVLGVPSPDTAVYVCGPNGFMDHVLGRAEALGWPSSVLHKERFTASVTDLDSEPSAAFTVRLASTGDEYLIPEDRTVLDVLRDSGLDVPASCEMGICGTCITRVLAGEPDHRDDVLTPEERDEGLFTPCISRARSAVLEVEM